MKNIILITKSVVLALVLLVVGLQFVAAYKTHVRNQAIDACAQNSFYQIQYTDEEGRQVTAREPQKHIFEQCLVRKGIFLEPLE
jgi:hypothetical protein